MNKVICDVCGTDYPETAAQCPICGCARAGGGQTTAGNDTEQSASGYTYVKGGRFSKANVKKRLKATQAQQAAQMRAERRKDEDDEDPDEELELGNASNKGLIVIVVLLLVAIIAVSSYIAVHFFGPRVQDKDHGYTQSTRPILPSSSSTAATEDPDRIACTGLTVHDPEPIELDTIGEVWEIFYEVEPGNTTDAISFDSSDPDVATVDANGIIKAVGEGEATITIKCGGFVEERTVRIQLGEDPGETTDPTVTDPSQTDPTEPTVTEPEDPELVLELNRQDFTLESESQKWQLYQDGPIDRSKITWSSDDESIATVTDGLVEPVGNGRTRIRAKYEDQEVSCWVTVKNMQAATEPEPTEPEPTEPEPTETEPTEPEPTEPAVEHELLVNGGTSYASVEGIENSADISLVAGDDPDTNQCKISVSGADSVQWSNSNEEVCSVDADGRITAKSAGSATLTAEVDGVTYTVRLYVMAS